MKRVYVLGLLLYAVTAVAAERVVATFTDPAGDDVGDGTLVYPQRSDFERGDLDLTSLRLIRDGAEYRVEAAFRNPIRDPASVISDIGSDSLAVYARRGFYAFNLDLYFDQDRIVGSGNVFTLPGRGAVIDPSFAWERAVVLTPRPELMRQQLIDALLATEPDRNRDATIAAIDRKVFFATQVRVRGRTVSFAIPAKFLAAGRADSDWALTALVTGAKTVIEADLNLFRAAGSALERLPLGAMQPDAGRPRDTFGYTGQRAPSAIVDLLAPSADQQRQLLARGGALAGVALSAAAVANAAGTATPVTSLLAGTSPRTAAPAVPASPAAAPSAGSVPTPAAPPSVPAAATAPAAPATAAPDTKPVPPPAVAPRAPARGSIAERLQQLKQLFDQKLIDEAEYKQQRQRILNEL